MAICLGLVMGAVQRKVHPRLAPVDDHTTTHWKERGVAVSSEGGRRPANCDPSLLSLPVVKTINAGRIDDLLLLCRFSAVTQQLDRWITRQPLDRTRSIVMFPLMQPRGQLPCTDGISPFPHVRYGKVVVVKTRVSLEWSGERRAQLY